MIWRPFTFVTLPVIVYCGFAYGCTVVWGLVTSGTTSLILSAPPYNFKASIVGLFSVAGLFGAICGSLLSGFLGDWLILKITRRNNGVVEAENRLWLLLFPVITYPFEYVLFGVGATHHIHCK